MADKDKDKRVDISDALGMVETRGLIGMIEAADGLVLTVEPNGAPGKRLTVHYQHIASATRV